MTKELIKAKMKYIYLLIHKKREIKADERGNLRFAVYYFLLLCFLNFSTDVEQ
jgi:hypothetical protein